MPVTIYDYRQFINWREELPDVGKTKLKKVPFNATTGERIDPHNPATWLSYAEAVATGALVGFVFTAHDPFFFVDLDDCATGGAWNPEALAVCNLFSGSAVEISRSGVGLHIVGTCDKSQFVDRKHKFGSPGRPANWIEFYTDGRFMALGSGFQGDFSLDRTEQLAGFVPIKVTLPVAVLASGPVAEYTGPADDTELIQKMMRATGGAGAAFGAKATLISLWNADPVALGAAYPSPSNDAFDRSSADAALMAHLAFWTGKDAARMDRLFRLSRLMRDKYEKRPEYRTSTIQNAVTNCRKVYDIPRATPAALPATAGNMTPTGDDYLNLIEMQHWFHECTYITTMHRVFMPDGSFLKPEQFNVIKGGKTFQMTMDASKPSNNAFEAFTQCRAINFPKAHGTRFLPVKEPRAMIGRDVNTYIPDPQPLQRGDVTPFLDHLQRLIPDPQDRAIILAYMAAIVQYPGVKFQWAVVIQGIQGNGKTFFARALTEAIGRRYTHWPAAEDLGNKFNAFLENKLLIAVEEIYMDGRREVLDTLKTLVTNEYVEIQPKGSDKYMADNAANWFFTTNHKNAVIQTEDDRRYSIFFSAQQLPEDIARSGMVGQYFPRLYDWARSGGYEMIHYFLKHYPIPDELNPAGACQRAPHTTSRDSAIAESRGRAEQAILELIANDEPGARGGWLSAYRLNVMMKEHGIRITPTRTKAIVESLGFCEAFRAGRPIFQEDNKKPKLFIRRGQYHRELTQADYEAAQGYVPAPMYK